MKLQSPTTFFPTRKQAEAVANANSDTDDWTYKVRQSKRDGKFVVAVYDTDGKFIENL